MGKYIEASYNGREENMDIPINFLNGIMHMDKYLTAGIGEMNYSKFIPYNIIGGGL